MTDEMHMFGGIASLRAGAILLQENPSDDHIIPHSLEMLLFLLRDGENPLLVVVCDYTH
jgi:hypothetical protein